MGSTASPSRGRVRQEPCWESHCPAHGAVMGNQSTSRRQTCPPRSRDIYTPRGTTIIEAFVEPDAAVLCMPSCGSCGGGETAEDEETSAGRRFHEDSPEVLHHIRQLERAHAEYLAQQIARSRGRSSFALYDNADNRLSVGADLAIRHNINSSGDDPSHATQEALQEALRVDVKSLASRTFSGPSKEVDHITNPFADASTGAVARNPRWAPGLPRGCAAPRARGALTRRRRGPRVG